MKKTEKITPLMKRIIFSKALGGIAGLVACLYLIFFMNSTIEFGIGVFFWYTITGVMIGFGGVMKKHPIFPAIKMPWWFRGTLFGAMMGLTFALLSFDALTTILTQINYFSSPYWVILDSAIIGLVIDFFSTKYFLEGKKLLK